ncbi:hypothetical protein FDUTEX481_08258 [Tolypothrix sp. PCC 7601]|nr:hypothetical protein FDUTEX481_08258 [Tolypothrix sp. PCC 7601]
MWLTTKLSGFQDLILIKRKLVLGKRVKVFYFPFPIPLFPLNRQVLPSFLHFPSPIPPEYRLFQPQIKTTIIPELDCLVP